MTDSLLEERVSELEEANRELQSKIEEFRDEIEDRRRAGQELQESEKRYRALIEGLNEAVYRMSLPDGRYEYFSSAVKSVFGYNAKDFLDNPKFIKKIIHPDLMNYFRREWANLIKGKVPPTYEYKIIDPAGNERWIIQSNKGVFDDEGNIIALEGICRDITERRKAGERLHATHRKLRATLDAIQDNMNVVDPDFNLVDVNDALLKAFGLPDRESVLGRKCFEVLKGREDVCPDCAVAEVYRTKAPAYRTSTPEDEESTGGRVFEIFVYPIMDERGNLLGAVEFARDITERRRVEEALRESEGRLRAVFETAQDSIFIKDRALRYTQVNPAMEQLFNLPASKLIGRTDDDLFDREAASHIREMDSRVLEGEIIEEEHTKKIGGLPFTFHVVKVPIRDESGGIIGLCGIARNITERKKAEKKLREKMDELETFNKMMVGRERKMVELKKEIRKLGEQLNKR